MTAIVFAAWPDVLVAYADTAFYDRIGVVHAFGQKVHVHLPQQMLVAASGGERLLGLVNARLGFRADFDDAAEHLAIDLRGALADAAELGETGLATAWVAGWSARAGAYRILAMNGADPDGPADALHFKPIEAGALFYSPPVNPGSLLREGICNEAGTFMGDDFDASALRLLGLMRRSRYRFQGAGALRLAMVGGRVQRTVLTRDPLECRTDFIHAWPSDGLGAPLGEDGGPTEDYVYPGEASERRADGQHPFFTIDIGD